MSIKRKAGCLFVCVVLFKLVLLVGGIWVLSYVGCAIKERGLKGVVEEVWEGEQNEDSQENSAPREGNVD
jgi:hypothetical protein